MTRSERTSIPPHPRILHVFATFDAGGPQVRTAKLVRALPETWRHRFLAMDGRTGAAALLPPEPGCEVLDVPPPPRGFLRVRRLRRLLRSLRPHLLCTYNWGAIEAAWAASTLPGLPVLHHEEGFGPEEIRRQKRRRVWFRRWVLSKVQGLIVPSRVLEGIALRDWKIRPPYLHYLPNGIETGAFHPPSPAERRAARAALRIPEGTVACGFVGGLRPIKDLPAMLEAFATLPKDAEALLLLAGEGSEGEALRARAGELGIADRVRLLGEIPDPLPLLHALDLFVLSSRSEQMPLSVLEAMACGIPVAATAVGDLPEMLREQGLVLPRAGDVAGLGKLWTELLEDEARRRAAGEANRRKVEKAYDFARMAASYRDLYESLLA